MLPVLPPKDVRELFDVLRQYQKGNGQHGSAWNNKCDM